MRPRSSLSLTLATLALAVVPTVNGHAEETAATETPEQREARMHWWREARFGMFIHWGLYAVPAGTWNGKQVPGIGEWIMNRGRIPVVDYAAFAAQFNPVRFDADQWVGLAKGAGMKYMVITAKHHDGFAMFATKASPYNIVDATPFKRDPLAELAAACRKQGMKLGFYYSQAQDWHHPGGAASGGHWDKAQDGDMTEYIKNIAVPQVKELLSNYGEFPAVLWWDTPHNMTRERADLLLAEVNRRPGLIWNNRLGGGYKGDTETPEQWIPATGYPGRDWETCMTMNGTWGFKSYDSNWKSTESLVRNLCDIASKGGNYLLNVGPNAEGLIPAPSVERLQQVGAWMAVNGEAIHATTASPFRRLPWGRATQKPGKLFLHVFHWPKDGRLTVPMAGSVGKARLLAKPDQALAVASGPDGVVVEVGATAPDPIASVVELEVSGEIKPQPVYIHPGDDGSFKLLAGDADIPGKAPSTHGDYESGELHLTRWETAEDQAAWTIRVDRPGSFAVAVDYALDRKGEGCDGLITCGDQKLNLHPAVTKGYSSTVVGNLTLGQAGVATITFQPAQKPKGGFLNLRAITLTRQP